MRCLTLPPKSGKTQFQQCVALPNMIAFLPAAVIKCGTLFFFFQDRDTAEYTRHMEGRF